MTESVEDLAAWLTRVWDEEERAARDEVELTEHVYDGEFTVEYQWARMTRHKSGGWGQSFAPGAPSPASVLARIAADRKILALHAPSGGECRTCCGEPYMEEYWDGEEETVVWKRADLPWPCPTLRLLASPYADREGFRPEWLVERQGVEQ